MSHTSESVTARHCLFLRLVTLCWGAVTLGTALQEPYFCSFCLGGYLGNNEKLVGTWCIMHLSSSPLARSFLLPIPVLYPSTPPPLHFPLRFFNPLKEIKEFRKKENCANQLRFVFGLSKLGMSNYAYQSESKESCCNFDLNRWQIGFATAWIELYWQKDPWEKCVSVQRPWQQWNALDPEVWYRPLDHDFILS
jgi:hypothetical protein